MTEDLMNAVCPKLYYPKAFKQRNWQVFWLAPSSMPSHSARNSGFGDSRTLSELTAAVSAQDFHLIPFSLIAPRLGETSTKIGCKYTDIYSFAKQFCIFSVCQDDFLILCPPHNSPAQENRKAHEDVPDASICLPPPVLSGDGEP